MTPTCQFKDDLPHIGVGEEPVVVPDGNFQGPLLQFCPFQADEDEGSIPLRTETSLDRLSLLLVSGAERDGDEDDGVVVVMMMMMMVVIMVVMTMVMIVVVIMMVVIVVVIMMVVMMMVR